MTVEFSRNTTISGLSDSFIVKTRYEALEDFSSEPSSDSIIGTKLPLSGSIFRLDSKLIVLPTYCIAKATSPDLFKSEILSS